MMRTYATVPIRISSAGAIRQPRTARCRIAARRSFLWRVRRFVVSVPWEGLLVNNPWIDRACWGVVALSVLYFTPVLLLK